MFEDLIDSPVGPMSSHGSSQHRGWPNIGSSSRQLIQRNTLDICGWVFAAMKMVPTSNAAIHFLIQICFVRRSIARSNAMLTGRPRTLPCLPLWPDPDLQRTNPASHRARDIRHPWLGHCSTSMHRRSSVHKTAVVDELVPRPSPREEPWLAVASAAHRWAERRDPVGADRLPVWPTRLDDLNLADDPSDVGAIRGDA